MASSIMVFFSVLALSPLCFASPHPDGYLSPQFYDHSCPKAQEIVRSIVAKAVSKEARMAASLLRLHFHDCFVKGCDASVLLDSTGTFLSEKQSNPNRNSARGFKVIDEIKTALEKECPLTVSCADILALAARDSTVLAWPSSFILAFMNWWSGLGGSIGEEGLTGGKLKWLQQQHSSSQQHPCIITKFKLQGLDLVDLVALSGSHTIGKSRCTGFRQRLYNQTGNGLPDGTLNAAYAAQLRTKCPRSGGDQNLFPLDFVSPTKFDNRYFKNLMAGKGLLGSDEVLFTKSAATMQLVKLYAENNKLFFEQFAKSMVKMGNISPLTGLRGEVRKHCRKVNQ